MFRGLQCFWMAGSGVDSVDRESRDRDYNNNDDDVRKEKLMASGPLSPSKLQGAFSVVPCRVADGSRLKRCRALVCVCVCDCVEAAAYGGC